MGSDGGVALSVLGSISLARTDHGHNSEGYFSGRYGGSLPSCSGAWSPVRVQELRCCGDEYHGAARLPSRRVPRCCFLHLKREPRLTSRAFTPFRSVAGEVSKRTRSGRSGGAALSTDEVVTALCSSIGLDAIRKHPGQLPPYEYGSHMERRTRRVSPSGRREMAVIAAATADSDQTLPSQNGGGEKVIPTKPHPEVHPSDVVQAQLKALREKDLATVFEFASPGNKARTGPLVRFSEMLEGRAYNVMIGHTSAEVLSTFTISSNRFQQRVVIHGSSGKQATFQWSLSRQEEGPYESCWMTDAVRRDD